MANTELDPLFLKGLRLLHSRSKDSTEQLKQLFEEALAQSKLSTVKDRTSSLVKLENESKIYIKKSSRDPPDLSTTKPLQEESKKREAEKRPLEKAKQDDIEVLLEAKLPKLDSPQILPYYPPSPDPPKLDHFIPKEMEEESEPSDDNANADDFAMEMGLACVICKQLDVTQGNQLIECQECHCLYHQECHSPPATDHDVNDPRRVWYCAKCMKNMKKMASKTQKSSKILSSAVTKESTSQARFAKPEAPQPSMVLPFKRTELKAPITQGSNQTSTNKPIGLAGLAANFSGRVTTASTAVSSSLSSRASSSKAPGQSLQKPFSNISGHSALSSLKIVPNTTTSSSSAVPPIVIAKSSTSTTTVKTGLGLLSAAISTTSNRTAVPASNNGGTKPATCSLLMSADKRVQIMKKRAAKLQEKRRLSTKS